MRIATLCGVLMVLAGCNQLPEPVSGDDQGLTGTGTAGAGPDSGMSDDDVRNGTTEASANDPSACELKAKECYANGEDPKLCESILQGCLPPATVPAPCGQDCDAQVRDCFAKGIDAKTCDAQYHACLGQQPGQGPAPGTDPNLECQLAAKNCYANGEDPALCDALLSKCTPPAPAVDPTTDPATDPATECELQRKECSAAGVDDATCDAKLKACYAQLAEDKAAFGAGANEKAPPMPGSAGANNPF